MSEVQIDDAALEAARKAVEDQLVWMRDERVSMFLGGNGFVIRERNGEPSDVIRLSTREGLRIGIRTYLTLTGQGESS